MYLFVTNKTVLHKVQNQADNLLQFFCGKRQATTNTNLPERKKHPLIQNDVSSYATSLSQNTSQTHPQSMIYSPPSYKRPVSISFTIEPTNKPWRLPTSNFSPLLHFPSPPLFSPPPTQKRKINTETSSIITATTNDSTNYQLTSKESKSIMETNIKENNIKMTTIINENFNKKLKYFQTTLIKTCEDMIAQQMSIIHLNMINIIKVILEEQRVTPQLSLPSNQQQAINQQPNILQYISPSTPVNTSTELSINDRQPNSKRKQTDPLDSEEEVNTSDDTNNQDTVMENQEISNPTQHKNISKIFNTRN